MTPERVKQVAELAVLLSIESRERMPADKAKKYHIIAEDAVKLASIATRLERYAVTECNYGLNESQHKRRKNLQHKFCEIVATYNPHGCQDNRGLVVKEFHNDPRGFSVYLGFPSNVYNSWGGAETGWGI